MTVAENLELTLPAGVGQELEREAQRRVLRHVVRRVVVPGAPGDAAACFNYRVVLGVAHDPAVRRPAAGVARFTTSVEVDRQFFGEDLSLSSIL